MLRDEVIDAMARAAAYHPWTLIIGTVVAGVAVGEAFAWLTGIAG